MPPPVGPHETDLAMFAADRREVINFTNPGPWTYDIEQDAGGFLHILRDSNRKLIVRSSLKQVVELVAFACGQKVKM